MASYTKYKPAQFQRTVHDSTCSFWLNPKLVWSENTKCSHFGLQRTVRSGGISFHENPIRQTKPTKTGNQIMVDFNFVELDCQDKKRPSSCSSAPSLLREVWEVYARKKWNNRNVPRRNYARQVRYVERRFINTITYTT